MTYNVFVNRHHIRMTAEWADANPNMSDMPAGSTHWKCVFRRGNRQMTVPFSMGPAHSHEPTAAEVLECLASDAQGDCETFEDFCASLGYETDSRKAEATWKAVETQTEKLRHFLDDLFDDLLQAEEAA